MILVPFAARGTRQVPDLQEILAVASTRWPRVGLRVVPAAPGEAPKRLRAVRLVPEVRR